MEERTTFTCVVCECQTAEGIRILSQFICADCEREMVGTEVDDELYEFFVVRLRAVWKDLMSASGPDASESGCVSP